MVELESCAEDASSLEILCISCTIDDIFLENEFNEFNSSPNSSFLFSSTVLLKLPSDITWASVSDFWMGLLITRVRVMPVIIKINRTEEIKMKEFIIICLKAFVALS